ncbi:MAG: hypothetical protein Q7P63_01940 [Verrucomicrobiota bacterium JB022]|nr:hypothetical protein [Verrucomicrobiota bacterium JB022]
MDLDPYVTEDSNREFKPDFDADTPRFSYFEKPRLPNGEFILALGFLDRYAKSATPDGYKWAGIVSFPWQDGLGRQAVSHLCLFYYDGQLYGWAPSGDDEHRRFIAPLEPSDLHRPYALLRFANNYVAEISPKRTEWVTAYYNDTDGVYILATDRQPFATYNQYGLGYAWGHMRTPEYAGDPNFYHDVWDDPYRYGAFGGGRVSVGPIGGRPMQVEVEAGKVAPPSPEQRPADYADLVSIYYYFLEMPNSTRGEGPIYGPEPEVERSGIDWAALFGRQPVSTGGAFHTAKELLGERWSQPARIKMRPDTPFFDNLPSYERVLLFALEEKVYAYTMEHGVWNTEVSLADLNAGDVKGKLAYPGGYEVEGLELLGW